MVPTMKAVLSNCSASISEFKKNHSTLIEQAEGEPILNHYRPTAYLIPAETYEQLIKRLEDYQLGFLVPARQQEKIAAVAVEIDEP